MDRLNLMRSFIAVYEAGSYTAAARQLGKTKALISTHVTQLEQHLQVRLITRSTRSIQPTASGRSYYEASRQILDELENMEARLRDQHHRLVGRLRITAPTTFGELVLMPFIAGMMADNPQLDMEVMLNDRYVNLVEEGFDVAIRIGQLEDSALVARRVGESRMRICAAPALLDRLGQPQNLTDLQDFPCVFDSNNRQSGGWHFSTEKAPLEIKPRFIARVNSALASANLARTGSALACCPDFAVQDMLENGELVSLLDDQHQTLAPIHILYPHRKHLSGRVSQFVQRFSDYWQG